MKKIIKLIISLAFIAFIFRFVEAGDVSETLKLLSFEQLLLIVSIYFFGQIISSFKWYLINLEFNLQRPFIENLIAYFTGMFVNSFGLGIVGGDVARALMIAPESQKVKALTSVFVDRLQGMLVLGLIGCFGYLVWINNFNPTIQYSILPLLIAFPCVSILWFFCPRLVLFFIPNKLNLNFKLGQAIAYYEGRKKHLVITSLLSVLMHLSQFYLLYLIAHFLGAEIPFHTLLVVIPFVNIITSLPFSWNGLGVREASLIFFLADFITNEQAVSMGLVWLVTVTINSLFGGALSLMSKTRTEEIQA